MPIPNSKDTQWNGYLIDGLGEATAQFLNQLQTKIQSRNLPKVNMHQATTNMWWRSNSLCLDVTSSLDGHVSCTIHVMDYGSSLFVGVGYNAGFLTDNYYKRMATASFLETIDRCVIEAIDATASEFDQSKAKIVSIGKSGRYGG